MRKIVHIGAHRTGTTSIQAALDENQDLLFESGVTAITAAGERSLLFDPLQKYVEAKGDEKKSLRAQLTILFDEILKASKDSDTLILSEENILGPMHVTFLGNQMGARAVDNLTAIKEFIGDDFEIVLSIRDFGTYFNSVFTYQFCKTIYRPFDHYRKMLLNRRYGWFQVVSQIRKAFPNNIIRVVPFEHYKSDFSKFFPLIGVNSHIQLPKLHKNRTRSALAIQHLEEAIKDRARIPNRRVREVVLIAHEQPFTPYQPWSASESKTLTNRYRRHIQAIKNPELNIEFIDS